MDVKRAFLYGTIEEESLYETLYLIKNGFRRGIIDKTLFIKKDTGDILLVQVYVDDIIFGSTNKSLCDEFEGLMHKRFQMSSMGELTFSLGLQVQQKKDGIFISQDKYVARVLKKFDFATVKTTSTPIEPNKALIKDEEADRGCQFLGKRLISWQCKKQTIVANSTTEAEYVAAANCCGQKPIIVPSSYQPKKTHKPRTAIRTTEISQSSGPINLVTNETVYKEWEDRMERAASTLPCLACRHRTVGTDSGSGPRCQDTILGGVDAQTSFETTFKKSNDPPLLRGYTHRSGEDSMKLLELMELCTKLSDLVSKKKREML
ncbi:putative ribonuclease H-like domain-containing protein [Tanacetum coccineum]